MEVPANCKAEERDFCKDCNEKRVLIEPLLKGGVEELSVKLNKALHEETSFSWTKIKTNSKMQFYTGISTIVIFSRLFDLIKPCLQNFIYWRGRTLCPLKEDHIYKESKKFTKRISF